MEYTKIPPLEVSASRIGLGTWAIGGWMWGGSDEKEAIACIRKALDTGVTLIDTAPAYGFGKAEKIVGKALKAHGGREKVLIATKVGLSWKGENVSRNASRERILKEIDDSLSRLQVDYIDLYQVHWPDPSTPISETAAVLKELLEKKKIRAIGVSNFSPEQIEEFRKFSPLHAVQPPFNLFEHEAENSILLLCLKHKMATLGYGSLCRGLLSGKMTKDTQFQGDDLRKTDPKFQQPRFADYLQCVQRLDAWAKKKHNRSVLSLAVRFALDKGISVALWGARRPEQLRDIESVCGWTLNAQDFQEIDQILTSSLKTSVGPEFMAPPT